MTTAVVICRTTSVGELVHVEVRLVCASRAAMYGTDAGGSGVTTLEEAVATPNGLEGV